jgi:hypothetical protein
MHTVYRRGGLTIRGALGERLKTRAELRYVDKCLATDSECRRPRFVAGPMFVAGYMNETRRHFVAVGKHQFVRFALPRCIFPSNFISNNFVFIFAFSLKA